MKQISEGETTTSSRPAFMALAAASLMAPTVSSPHGMTAVDLYHTAARSARYRPAAPRRYTARMELPSSGVVDFYNRHPISEGQIEDALRRLGDRKSTRLNSSH